MTKSKKGKKNKNTFIRLFVWFIVVALAVIVLLEYLDYQKGKKSFIFTKIIPLKKTESSIRYWNDRLITILKVNKIHYVHFQDKENKYHFQLNIEQERFDGLIAKIKVITDQLKGELILTEIQGLTDKSILVYEVMLDQKVTHLLLITKLRPGPVRDKPPKTEARPREKTREKIPGLPPSAPQIAFIIDDIGTYEIGPLELKRLKIPITASVLPDSHLASEAVYWLEEYKIKTMIHLPMQPTNSNGKHYDPQKVITVQSTDEEIRALIRRARQIVPQAEGVNNHEGSLVTANKELITRVLKIIKEEGLFFVDSRTTGRSEAYGVARELGIRAAYKDAFLDHIPTYSHSLAQIRTLVEIALQKGKAIAIGHPLESTLRALHDSIPYIQKKGVKIVYVQELLEPPAGEN